MKAEDVHLTELLEGPRQFIVPVFQRDYSWGTKHCLQLWEDILRVGSSKDVKAHFVGSVVYVAAEDSSVNVTRSLLIDGQQRLATLTLLLTAMRNRLPVVDPGPQASTDDGLPTRSELEDNYLFNRHGKGDRRQKLSLRRADQSTLAALLDSKDLPTEPSERIRDNYEFFVERLESAELDLVYRGIKKLVAVNVRLTHGQDDPQMIFESLNSTGLDLTQADLIRNFVLMRQGEEVQTQLYNDYWQPLEHAFGARNRDEFDKFMRDYLTLQDRPGKQLKSDEIYRNFQDFFCSAETNTSIKNILSELRRFGAYYVAFSLGQEQNPQLKEVLGRLRSLVEVAAPVVMRLYDCNERTKTLTTEEFVKGVELLESYVFRRSACDMQTRNLGRIFASLAYRINEDNPLVSLQVALYRQGENRKFPNDAEFRKALETRPIYDMRQIKYLLDRLENDSKERTDTSKYTIEHVMPQNDKVSSDWQKMLGADWQAVREVWLHRLGNLTLTGYNSEYSDKSFPVKKTTQNGFDESPIRLNKFIREQNQWTVAEMEKRGKELATKAISIWPALSVDREAVKKAELEDNKAEAARYTIDDLEFSPESKALFDQLRPQMLALGDGISELPGANSVTYRVYDYFVEIVPRRRRLSLVVNLDFDECEDPTSRAADATDTRITHATESGGVLFTVDDSAQISAAIHIVRQAYEKVSE